MATLKQLELPDELLRSIVDRANKQGISVEEQVVRDLALVESGRENSSEPELLAAVRREREELASKGVSLTDEVFAAARNWGRK